MTQHIITIRDFIRVFSHMRLHGWHRHETGLYWYDSGNYMFFVLEPDWQLIRKVWAKTPEKAIAFFLGEIQEHEAMEIDLPPLYFEGKKEGD